MSKFGGGGAKCTICDKTAYPAETIQYEKKPYHVECFKCSECDKKMEGAAKASNFEDRLYCNNCFQKGGFAQKQKNVKWVKKEGGGSSVASKFGGGGNPCTICSKTVYPAETVSFEKQIYHADCFKCSKDTCAKKLTPSDAAAFEDAIFCRKCFKDDGYSRKQTKVTKGSSSGSTSSRFSKFGGGGSKCTICEKTVYPAEALSYEKMVYHADCFKCSECDKKVTPSGAAKFEDKIYCTKCFTAGGYNRKQTQTASKSGGSSKANALASRFGGGGTKCVRCDKTVYSAELISYEKNAFHAACFTCKKCEKKLSPSGTEGKKLDDGSVDIYCKKCWGEEGLNRADKN